MATKKKLLQAAAGSAGGAALNVEDVFSTYLYTGDGSTQTITNEIDLAGEGGLVWIKNRDNGARHHGLFDTERGIYKAVYSNQSWAEGTNTGYLTAFNSNGFSLGSVADFNGSGESHASWTFRKAPKFFDVVTYTGNATAGRTISHNLGSVPGCIIVKRLNGADNWTVYHRGIDSTAPEDYTLYLNDTTARTNQDLWADTAPTSTEFSVGDNIKVNGNSSNTYVAYLFAHNNSDGDFGPDGDADIIKCGSYTGAGATDVDVDLGFEPQWVLIKKSSASGDQWLMLDNMRGTVTGGNDNRLFANLSNSEAANDYLEFTSTGFRITGTSGDVASSGETYIYIAIRRGPMAVPESATDVFTPLLGLTSSSAPPIYQASHTIDMVIEQPRFGDSAVIIDRLRAGADTGKLLKTSSSAAETGNASYTMDYQTGAFNRYSGQSTWYVGQCFRRAPNFFDVVAYSGTGVARTISHNLGAVPEMMWVKSRTNTRNWAVYHKGADASPESGLLRLDTTTAFATGITTWNNTQPTASVFSVGTRNETNNASETFIAYLFATLDGVSKVGSFTGNGTNQNIDCGFSSGARFVLIKRTDSTGDWYVWDTERGIVAANDPHLSLNTTAAEVTTDDSVDPVSSGFAVNQVAATNINVSSATYIFYAIA